MMASNFYKFCINETCNRDHSSRAMASYKTFLEMDVIGNVKDEIIKPSNYNGPTMVGHLMFDADFESGNLGRIEYSTDNEYDLFIRVDTCNQKYRLWDGFVIIVSSSVISSFLFNELPYSTTI